MQVNAEARRPGGWRQNRVVRFFASLNTGITLLTLVLVYACVFSALPQVRGAVEVTEMQAFSHWLFTTLTVLLCVSVLVATLARIPFNLPNLGVWTVHAGILLLCGGALWYFGSKIEGDVILRSPRLELVTTSMGGERTIAALLPEPGQTWSNFMPAFGGDVTLEVKGTATSAAGGIQQATVRVTIGSAEPVDVSVAAADGAATPINDRLGLRLETFPGERTFYHHEHAALWYRGSADPNWHTSELAGLPYFRERYLDEGYVLEDTAGRPEPSKRTTPAVTLAGITIPTGWFENWRLPLRPATPGLPFDVEITGYVPYIGGMRQLAVGGGTALNPGMNVRLAIANTDQMIERALFARRPSASSIDLRSPVEFRWVESADERDALLAPLAGPSELAIEIKEPPVSKTVVVAAGEVIEVEGTPYRLRIQQIMPSWPLISPGFEGATSPAAIIEVESDTKKFTRTVIQRYPQFTQDIDETGMRRKVGLYDENIVMRFRTAENGCALLVGDSAGAARGDLLLGVFSPDGQVETRTVRVGDNAPLSLGGLPLILTVLDLFEKAQGGEIPVVEALETRRPSVAARSASAIRLKLTGKDAFAGWSETRWMRFSQYPHVDPVPLQIRPPGALETYELIYSRMPHDLGATLIPQKLTVNFFPGRRSVESWRSYFRVEPDEDEPHIGTVYTNQTYAVGPWTLFQSGAAQDHWSYTILGVGNRRGIWPMVLGCTMITLGCLWAFYVKPALKRRAVERVREQERARAGHGGAKPARADVREMVHTG